MNVKIPKIIFGPPIAILIAILLSVILTNTAIEPLTDAENSTFEDFSREQDSEIFSNNLYSGPFAIMDGTYKVNDTISNRE